MYKKVLKSIKDQTTLKNEVLAGLYKNEENSVMARQPHFLFSAENPMYPENHVYNLKHDEVLNMLKQKGYKAESVNGHYGKPERSILVHNPPSHAIPHLFDLSKKLGQESSIYSNGYDHEMHFHGGPNAGMHIKGQGTNFHKRKPDDYFTEMNNGASFTHHFNFDEMHPSEKSISQPAPLYTKKSEIDFIKSEPNHPLINAGPETKLIHFSTTPGLKNIDPNFQGQRIKDASSKYAKPEHPVSFFYLEGAKPEQLVTNGASTKYIAKLGHHKVYDLGTDPENIRQELKDSGKTLNPGIVTRDELDGAIKAKGYHGIYNSLHPIEDHRMVVGMYHRMPVHKEVSFHPKDSTIATDQAYEQHPSAINSAQSPQESPHPDKLAKFEEDIKKSVGTDEDANPLMNRVEDKYFLKADKLNDVISVLKLQLPNGDIDTSTRYSINRTIYLDNRDLDSFQDNLMSVKPRFKVRIRQYNPNGEGWEDVAYIELKIKEKDGMTRKLRVRIPDTLIDKVANGESISVDNALIDLNRDLEKTVVWKRTALINSVILKYGFKKQLVVEYNRRAYSSGNIRITIDDSLKYHSFQPIEKDVMGYITNSDNWKKSIKPVKKLMSNDLLIMEVKHEEEIPKWIKQILNSSKAKEVRFSKYCAAIATFIMSNGNTEGRVQQQKKVGAYEILDILHSSPEIMEKNEDHDTVLSGKHSQRLNILMKGAMARVAPYNPDKHISPEEHKATENWTSEGDDQDARSNVPEMHANAKVRALHKLGKLTDVRRHPKTGERMYLLHRGMGEGEYALNHKGAVSNYAPGSMTSWTPHYSVAQGFANDHLEGQKPRIASAWVPESEIHNIPNATMIPDENSQFRNEHEIIVNHRTPHPHANKELVIKARNPRLFLDNKINMRGEREAALKDPTPPEEMHRKQVDRTVRAEQYKRSKFGKREVIATKSLVKSDISSKIKNGVAGLAIAASTLAPSNMATTQEAQASQQPQMEQQQQAPVNQRKQRILSSIMDVESSGGRNTNHKAMPKASIHQGEKAYGSYGLMPLIIRETIKSNPAFKQHVQAQKLMGDKMHAYMNKHPGLEKQIAEAHYDRLAKQFGDNPDKIGYAWLNGIHGTWKALKDKRPLKEHQYVKKILKAYAEHKKAIK